MAVVYSASEICLCNLFPCLKLLKDTTGPGDRRSLSQMVRIVTLFDCLIAGGIPKS